MSLLLKVATVVVNVCFEVASSAVSLLLKVVIITVHFIRRNSSVFSVLIKVATTVVLFVVIPLLCHCHLK